MRPICFGDVFCFEDVEAGGFVKGDPGLTDAVYVDIFPKFDASLVSKTQWHCCFVIEHAREYSARKAFLRKLRSSQQQLTEATWRSQLDPGNPLYLELEELHERVQDEKVTNEIETERIIGMPVEYGSFVQIRHFSSSMILSQAKTRAALNALALQVYLSEEGSEGSKWRLLPTVKIKGEGEEVYVGDQIFLASAKHRSSFLATYMVSSERQLFNSEVNLSGLASTVRPSGSKDRYEVNLSEQATKYRIALFRSVRPGLGPELGAALLGEREPLKTTDVVTVCHKQQDLYLVADEQEGIRWEPRSAAWLDAENPVPSAMWIIFRRSLDQGDGCLRVPASSMALHHLASGLCLCVRRGLLLPQPLSLARPGLKEGLWSLVGMGLQEEGAPAEPLRDGDFCWIRHDEPEGQGPAYARAVKRWLSAPDAGYEEAAAGKTHPLESARHPRTPQNATNRADAALREAAAGNVLDVIEVSLVPRGAWTAADLVRRAARGMAHAERAVRDGIAQSPACPPPTAYGRAVEKWFAASELEGALKGVRRALDSSAEALARVCGSRLSAQQMRSGRGEGGGVGEAEGAHAEGEKGGAGEGSGWPGLLVRRQLLRKFGVLDTAVSIVKACLEEATIHPSLIPRLPEVQELLRIVLALVTVACRGWENRDNKKAMAPALPLLQACLVADCGAYGAILSVYSGTREILEGLEDHVFTDTMASLTETRLPTVLSLAIEACRCDGLPIKKNQDRWVRAIFPPPAGVDPNRTWRQDAAPSPVCMDLVVDPARAEVLLFTWERSKRGTRIALSMRRNAMVDENNLPLGENETALTPAFVLEYHLAVMRLLAALLSGGNLLARAALMSRARRLGLECGQLHSMLANDSLPYIFRARCADLVRHLYVEASLRRRLPETLSLIWVWRKVQEEYRDQTGSDSMLEHDVLSPADLQQLKDVVLSNLGRVERGKHGNERSEHELHKSLVSLLRALLEAGFYHRQERSHLVVDAGEVSKLADPLIGLLGESSEGTAPGYRGAEASRKGSVHSFRRVQVEVKVKALQLLGRLVECCWFTRSGVLLSAFEDILAEQLQCVDWDGMLATLKAASMHRGEEHKQKLGEMAKRFFGVGPSHTLEDYAAVPELWATKPPWSQTTNDSLDRALFEKHPLMPELSMTSLESLGQRGSGGKPNRVISVVLALVLDEDLTLKERAIQFLFQVFKQRGGVFTMVEEATFICQPGVLSSYSRIHADLHHLLAIARVIRDAPHPSFEREVADLHANQAAGDAAQQLQSIFVPEREERTGRKGAGSNGTGAEEYVDEEWLAAVDRAAEILSSWVSAGERSPEGWEASSTEVQRMLSQLEVQYSLASLLATPLRRKARPGAFDEPVAEGQRVAKMLAGCVAVVAGLCAHSDRQRAFWTSHADQLWRLVGVQGVGAENALAAMVRGNDALIGAEGGRWARRYFREVVERCECCHARGLEFVAALLSPRGATSSEVIMAVLSRFKDLESRHSVLLRGAEGWDRRCDMLRYDELSTGGEASNLALHLAAVRLLANACMGKNTAAEMYCSHLLPFPEVVGTLRRINKDSRGNVWEIPKTAEYRTKRSYLKVLYNIYVETSAAELLSQMFAPNNGVWEAEKEEFPPGRSLVDILLSDIKHFRSVASLWRGSERLGKGKEAEALAALMAYLVDVALPLLSALHGHKATLESMTSRQVKVAEAIAQELQELYNLQLPLACSITMLGSQAVYVKDAIKRTLTDILACLGRTEQVSASSKAEGRGRVIPAGHVVRRGLKALVHSVAVHARGQHSNPELRSIDSVGSRHLARLLAVDDALELREQAVGGSQSPKSPGRGRRRRRGHGGHFSYSQVAMSMLAPSRVDSESSSKELLVDILGTFRAALYLAEPAEPHLSNDEIEERLEAYMQDAPIEKKHEPTEEMLAWVQDKYDAMGCTEAALRLLGHEGEEVHYSALRLLLALLQGGNRRVQNTVRVLLPSKVGRRALQRIKAIVGAGVAQVAAHKRNIKVQRQAAKFRGAAGSDMPPEEEEGANASEAAAAAAAQFGRQSVLMFALRLVQLLCEGQYAPLQDRMADRSDGASVLEQCVDLFLGIQSALSEALAKGSGDLGVLCVQVIETISECVQGPNRGNQQVLLAGDFFSGVNRLLSTLTFSPQREEAPLRSWMTTNNLKCWLKHSVLGCCIAMFEAVRDAKELQNLFKLVHVPNLVSQLVSAAKILRLPVVSAQPTGDDGDEEGEEAGMQANAKPPSLLQVSLDESFGVRALTRKSKHKGQQSQTFRSWRKLQKAGKETHWEETFAKGSDSELLEYLLRLHILLLIFKEYCLEAAPRLRVQQFEAEQPELAAFLNTHTSHIECVRQLDHTGEPLAEKVFFDVRPEVARVVRSQDFLHRAAPIIFDVPRENPWEKGREFIKRVKVVNYSLDWYEVVRKWKLLRVCINWRGTIDASPFWVAAIITLLLLVVYGLPWDPNTHSVFGDGRFYGFESLPPTYEKGAEPYPLANATSHPDSLGATYGSVLNQIDLALKYRMSLKSRWNSDVEWVVFEPWGRPLVYGFCIFHCVLSGTSSILHLVLDFPLTVLACLEDARVRAPADSPQQGGMALSGQGYLDNLPPIPTVADSYSWWAVGRALLRRSRQTLYIALLLIVSILGVLESPFFHVLYLLDAFRGVNGKLVVRSMVVGGPNLLRTFLLAIVVLVCFGFFSYSFFSVVVNGNQELCHSPYQCVAIHLLDSLTGDMTTVLGDDLGDFAFPATAVWADTWEAFRTFTVVISIVVWVFLLQGIIQGQIIDAFAEMRDKVQEANSDLERKCFVSSVDRFVFQSFPGEWEKRKNGKFAWNYLLYFSHLRHKDPEEYNGMDHFAAKAFSEERADLLPIGVFVARQKTEQRGKESEVEKQMLSLQAQVARMQRQLDAMAAASAAADPAARRLSVQSTLSESPDNRLSLEGSPMAAVRSSRALLPPLAIRTFQSLSSRTLVPPPEPEVDIEPAGSFSTHPPLASFDGMQALRRGSAQSTPRTGQAPRADAASLASSRPSTPEVPWEGPLPLLEEDFQPPEAPFATHREQSVGEC